MLIRSLIATAVAMTALPAMAQTGAGAAPAEARPVKLASAKPCRIVKWHPTPPGKPNSYILRERRVGDCSSATALNDARIAAGVAVQAAD